MDNLSESKKSAKIEIKDGLKVLDQITVKEVKVGPTILLESSFVMALLNPEDSNHKTVKALFGFVEPYNCRFHIPLFVFYEVLSKIIHQEKRVSIAISTLNNFIKNLHGVLFTGTNPNLEELVKRYKTFARKEIKSLQSNDFIIATEGILSGSIILTCDHEMYTSVKNYYEDIYYVATNSSKYKDDVPHFTSKFLKLVSHK